MPSHTISSLHHPFLLLLSRLQEESTISPQPCEFLKVRISSKPRFENMQDRMKRRTIANSCTRYRNQGKGWEPWTIRPIPRGVEDTTGRIRHSIEGGSVPWGEIEGRSGMRIVDGWGIPLKLVIADSPTCISRIAMHTCFRYHLWFNCEIESGL